MIGSTRDLRTLRSAAAHAAALAASLLAAACAGPSYAPGSVAQGSACNYDLDCAPLGGMSTVFCGCSSSHGSPVCHTYNTLPSLSQACGAVTCPDTQICLWGTDPKGRCVDRPVAGEPCAPGECVPGLFCNPAGKRCERPHALGEACAAAVPESCVAPATCDGASARCVAPGAEGASCRTAACAAGLRCGGKTATCVAAQPNGASCADDEACLSEECVSGSCETRQCS